MKQLFIFLLIENKSKKNILKVLFFKGFDYNRSRCYYNQPNDNVFQMFFQINSELVDKKFIQIMSSKNQRKRP